LGILEGATKEDLLKPKFTPKSLGTNYWNDNPLCPEIESVVNGSFKEKEPPQIKGSGFVVETLESVLWAFYKTNSFKEGLIKLVNLGDDADTTGAIYGQLAGAFYREISIPLEWRNKLTFKPLLELFADEIYSFGEQMVWTKDPKSVQLSERYLSSQICYRFLEDGYRPILRKLLPGPHLYKKLNDFDHDVKALFKGYNSTTHNSNCEAKDSFKKDFEIRLKANKETLELKIGKK